MAFKTFPWLTFLLPLLFKERVSISLRMVCCTPFIILTRVTDFTVLWTSVLLVGLSGYHRKDISLIFEEEHTRKNDKNQD
jgi:hypothetical protein